METAIHLLTLLKKRHVASRRKQRSKTLELLYRNTQHACQLIKNIRYEISGTTARWLLLDQPVLLFYFRLKWFSGTPSTWCRIRWCCFYFRIGYISVTYSFAQRRRSNLRTQVNNIEYFPPNFEGLVLGCIDADFCK